MNLEGLRIDRSGKRPKRKWTGRMVLLAAILAVLLLLRRPIASIYDRVTLPLVVTFRVERTDPAATDAIRGKAANGYVVAARRAALSADFSGRIAEMDVREGSVVKKGDVVARIASEEQAAAVESARANLAAASDGVARAEADLTATHTDLERLQRQQDAAAASVKAATARLEQARSELARVKRLVSQQVSTKSDLDQASAAFDVARADLDSANAALAAARSAVASGEAHENVSKVDVRIAKAKRDAASGALDQARAAYEKTIIRAPFDGIVVLKDAEVGEVVSPYSQGGSNARGAVATLVDFHSLEVQANVPETSLDAVRIGAPARIYLDAWPDHPYEGRVDRIWPTADRQKGTIEVRVVFLHPDERLRPDMGVRVVFLPEGTPAAPPAGAKPEILVPADTIVTRKGHSVAFVVDGDRVRVRPVRTGARESGRIAALKGLEPGERIVVSPPSSLKDGDRIRVKE